MRPLVRLNGYTQECPDNVVLDGTCGDILLVARQGNAGVTLIANDTGVDGSLYLWEKALLPTGRRAYFEAIGAGSLNAGVLLNLYVSLYTAAGVQVAGSEVLISSLTPKRVRSGVLTLIDNTEYTVRYRTSGLAGTAYLYQARLLTR